MGKGEIEQEYIEMRGKCKRKYGKRESGKIL
jgi:hypothetical protein